MQTIQRLMTNICTDDLQKSKDFYVTFFKLSVSFESEWFIQLRDEAQGFELGLMDRHHELVPETYQQIPNGFYLTFVVADADEAHRLAQDQGIDVLHPPQDTFYGQRRLLLKAPEGTLVDISSLIAHP